MSEDEMITGEGVRMAPRESETELVELTPEQVAAERRAANEERLANVLQGVGETVKQSQGLASVLADPDVRALLNAKQTGQRVAVTIGEPEALKPEPLQLPSDSDIDAMSNKEVVKLVLRVMPQVVKSAVQPVVDARVGEATKPIDELRTVVNALTAQLQGDASAKAKLEVDACKASHDDFEDYRQGMLALSQQAPSLKPEELYQIVKQRAVGTTSVRAASERPTATSTRRVRDAKPVVGLSGFRSVLSDALARMDFGSKDD